MQQRENEGGTGRCLCGAVTYRFEGRPSSVGLCQCERGQRQSGSAFLIGVVFPMEAVTIEGALSTFESRVWTCPAGQPYYYEGPTGFWIVNPGTELLGNSIGGCQSTGKGYWYIAPTTQNWMDPAKNNFQMVNLPVGAFVNNRAHACYDGIFGEGEAGIAGVNQLQPKIDGDNNKQNIVAQFTGFTASRIRNRGVFRPD